MKREQILSDLIMCYQNDVESGLISLIERDEITEEEYHNICKSFSNLIIEFTRLTHDVRYCSQKDCPCAPEVKIKQLVEKLDGYFDKLGLLFPVKKSVLLEAIE